MTFFIFPVTYKNFNAMKWYSVPPWSFMYHAIESICDRAEVRFSLSWWNRGVFLMMSSNKSLYRGIRWTGVMRRAFNFF